MVIISAHITLLSSFINKSPFPSKECFYYCILLNTLTFRIVSAGKGCNNFQVINDLVHDFMNFNAWKIILKIHKK